MEEFHQTSTNIAIKCSTTLNALVCYSKNDPSTFTAKTINN